MKHLDMCWAMKHRDVTIFTDPYWKQVRGFGAVTVLNLDAGRTLKRKKWACKALLSKGEGTDGGWGGAVNCYWKLEVECICICICIHIYDMHILINYSIYI